MSLSAVNDPIPIYFFLIFQVYDKPSSIPQIHLSPKVSRICSGTQGFCVLELETGSFYGQRTPPSTLENKCIIKGSYRAGWVPSPTSMLIEVFIFYVLKSQPGRIRMSVESTGRMEEVKERCAKLQSEQS